MSRPQKLALAAGAALLTLAAAVAIALGANTVAGHATPAPTVPVTEPAPAPEPADEPDEALAVDELDTIYLSVVSPAIPSASDNDLIIAGRAVCITLDETPSPTSATFLGIATGITDNFPWSWEQAGTVMGAAVTAWCPTYDYLLG
jgi:hypothetical protein